MSETLIIAEPDNVAIADRLFDVVLDVASGKATKSELNGFREISIGKDGVTL